MIAGAAPAAQSAPDAPEFMLVAEVADLFRVDTSTIYRRIEAGHLPAVRISDRCIRIPTAAVRNLLDGA